MNSEHFFVAIQHRPRRIAFLVDVEASPARLFDEIVDFNCSAWGGRYNPIIPVSGGEIPEPYWRLLALIDPDILYTYCDLPSDLVRRIATDVRPQNVLKHSAPIDLEQLRYGVRIRDQATVISILKRILNQFPVYDRNPEPAILVLRDSAPQQTGSMAYRNFGGCRELSVWCRDNLVPYQLVSRSDSDALAALAGNRNLVQPIDVCAEVSRHPVARTSYSDVSLDIYFGSSEWNFVGFWNSALFRSKSVRAVRELWLPTGLLQDPTFYLSFLSLIKLRVFGSRGIPHVRMISYDEPESAMKEITDKICRDMKGNIYAAGQLRRQKGDLPEFELPRLDPPSLIVHRTSGARGEQLSGNETFVKLAPLPDVLPGSNERWVAEIAVESPQQERYFANRESWWMLPRENGLSRLFLPHSPGRIGNDHLITADVFAGQQGVLLRNPDLARIFEALLIKPSVPDWALALDPALRENQSDGLYLRSSDKGRYASGVLGLFGSLERAAQVFEHDFWRAAIESLAVPAASPHTRNKVRNDLDRVGISALCAADAIDAVVDEVLDAAGRIQRPTPYASFDALFDSYWNHLEALPVSEQVYEAGLLTSGSDQLAKPSDIRKAARHKLRNMLSELTSRKIFFHGAKLQCDHCLATLWYHIDDLHSVVVCRGCRRDIDLPAETPWSYSLNELIGSAVRDHGVIPVLRTAFRLFKGSRECFCFLPGVELRNFRTDPDHQLCEIDLVWIRDGEFGIAEVKRTARKFAVGAGLSNVLNLAVPDRFLLASPFGTKDQMQQLRSAVVKNIDPRVTVESWSVEDFAHGPQLDWNTIRYSVFP